MKNKFNTVLVLIFTSCLISCEVSINKDHVAEGTKLMSQGEFFDADLEFDDALFADENNLDALRGSWYCAYNMGNYKKAMQRVNTFIKLKPDSAIGYNDRGLIFMTTKDYEKALQDFNKVIELGMAETTIIYFNKGEVLKELNRYREALACFKTVTDADKKDARAFYKSGELYKKLGVKDSACMCFRIAKELGDEDAAKEYLSACN